MIWRVSILVSEGGLPSYVITDKDNGGDIICSEKLNFSGKETLITAKIKLYRDKKNVKGNAAVISVACDNKEIPKEVVLGRGSLMVLSKILAGDILVNLPQGYPVGLGSKQKFVVEMFGPKAALACPSALDDFFPVSPISQNLFLFIMLRLSRTKHRGYLVTGLPESPASR